MCFEVDGLFVIDYVCVMLVGVSIYDFFVCFEFVVEGFVIGFVSVCIDGVWIDIFVFVEVCMFMISLC